MRQVLIVYGTTDGQTAKIAEAVGATLREQGAFVDIIEARIGGRWVKPNGYDAVIVAASVHAGGFQRAVASWLDLHEWGLTGKPTAFIGVCLAILENKPGPTAEINRIVQSFLNDHGFQPDVIKLVAGAVRYSRYGWLKKRIMKRIMLKAGGGTDTRQDYEYTDWEDLRRFTGAFAVHHALGSTPASVT